MAVVIMYSTRFCPYCTRARQLLKAKGVIPKEIAVDHDPTMRAEMQYRSGRSSVPQIFIDDQHVGGYTELWRLGQSGELDVLLGLTADDAPSQEEKP